MVEKARPEFLSMVTSYQYRGDPTGWFDNRRSHGLIFFQYRPLNHKLSGSR